MTKVVQMKKVLKKGVAALLLTSVMLVGLGSSAQAVYCPEIAMSGNHYCYKIDIQTTLIPILTDDATGKTFYITYNEWTWKCRGCGTIYKQDVTIGHTTR
ncbi:MAG: hypothetical protein K6A72_04415 [Lachnospiraceae bacterium]|nr:hypothetical protein [Lachnospiraceae bacterium]